MARYSWDLDGNHASKIRENIPPHHGHTERRTRYSRRTNCSDAKGAESVQYCSLQKVRLAGHELDPPARYDCHEGRGAVQGDAKEHRSEHTVADVRLWHLADVNGLPINVRFRRSSRHHKFMVPCPLMTQSGRRRVSRLIHKHRIAWPRRLSGTVRTARSRDGEIAWPQGTS